jgi:DNA (cytosine-5)-methyltransferase 1
VREIGTAQLPGVADLVWASFPCQDLSLAGAGAGLAGERSGTFWPFWGLMQALRVEGRAPKTIVLENVCGALTSHGGKDFAALCAALAEGGYRFGALVIDAALFLPQSRPRLFIIAVRADIPIPASLVGQEGAAPFHTRALMTACENFPKKLKQDWLWWRLPAPPLSNTTLLDCIEAAPRDVVWHSAAETKTLLAMMSPRNLDRIEEAKRTGRRTVGTLYRRTRYVNGEKRQCAEARFDDLAGCLRTPAGGSSRQFVLLVEKGRVRARLMSARETARLMGLPESYILPENYNAAYHLTGDGVVAPVVRHIAASLIEPLLKSGCVRIAA